MKIATVGALLLAVMSLHLQAPEGQASMEAMAPVATACPGFTPSRAKEIRDPHGCEQVTSAGEGSMLHFLDAGTRLPTAIVSRQGNLVELATAVEADRTNRRRSVGNRFNTTV